MNDNGDDFELSTEELEQTTAALSNNAYRRSSEALNPFNLNRLSYFKALEKRATKLYNLVMIAVKSDKGNKKVSNNKF